MPSWERLLDKLEKEAAGVFDLHGHCAEMDHVFNITVSNLTLFSWSLCIVEVV